LLRSNRGGAFISAISLAIGEKNNAAQRPLIAVDGQAVFCVLIESRLIPAKIIISSR
jgi:hypothetical protein